LENVDFEEETAAVVIACGDFSPVHHGHIEMLNLAVARLERAGHVVVARLLSPSGDKAAAKKAKQFGHVHLRAPLRLHLCRLAVAKDEQIRVASWEASQTADVKPVEVASALHHEISHRFRDVIPRNNSVRIFMVCGADKQRAHKGLRPEHHEGLLVVPRSPADCLLENPNHMVFAADEPPEGGLGSLSSTKIRLAVQSGDRGYVRHVTAPGVADLLLLDACAREKGLAPEIIEDLEQLAVGAERTEGAWPMNKAVPWIEKAETGYDDGQPFAALVACGAFAPVHQGHLDMMRRARERLERAGYVVIGGWISPVNSEEAAKEAARTKQSIPSAKFRIHAAQLSVEGDDWIDVGTWQADVQGRIPGYTEVMASLKASVEERFYGSCQLHHVKVFLVGGPDTLGKKAVQQGILSDTTRGLVVAPRSEDDILMERTFEGVFSSDPSEQDAFVTMSSTQVRDFIRCGQVADASAAMAPAAARFVLYPTASEIMDMQADFELLGVAPLQGGELKQAQDRLKAVLRAWTGPKGTIGVDDLGRVLQLLDPSWRPEELKLLQENCAIDGGGVSPEEFIDTIFKCYER